MFKHLFLTVMVFGMAQAVSIAPTMAQSDVITEDMVAQKYSQLEKVLNNRADYMSAVKFLHTHISDDAKIRVTVSNPVANNAAKSPAMEMSKEAYINTYLQGTQFVEGYQMDIEMAGFEYDPQSQSAATLEIMTERGEVKGLNESKAFVSKTMCRTEHKLQGDAVVAMASQCHTDISFEENV